MSKIGKEPIPLPDGVELKISGRLHTVKGPKGELSQEVDERITVTAADGIVTLTRANDEKSVRSLHGLYRALLANMVIGVSEGYEKTLLLIGIGFAAEMKGRKMLLHLGFSHPVLFELPDGIDFEINKPDPQQKSEFRNMQSQIVIKGIDKQLVGQVTANLRALKRPEPYKGKGIRYINEYVRKKAGKQVATAAA
ncbi:MAG: 50S ribosomal protein L6 [Candidatus Marinimicrobia bacterium]|nr:50S ribosomal protein L6 [Candidatus Neomarinimicrobiota bacterium]MCH7955505.1 50S ribosomal protein L6 [Candidatus Neomarinimicrobiota bacterium]